jgi:D-glycero-D-manno-heptose 1,7-bisphosphate phosphatase
MAETLRPAVFLDRDGTLNVDTHYLYKAEDWVWIAGAPAAIARLNAAGFLVVIVSNQSGIARGYYTEQDLATLNAFIARDLAKASAHIDLFLHCPHYPEISGPCACRKPGTGMIDAACAALPIDRTRSFLVGDRLSDAEAGRNAGLAPLLVRTGSTAEQVMDLPAQQQFPSIVEAVDFILHTHPA